MYRCAHRENAFMRVAVIAEPVVGVHPGRLHPAPSACHLGQLSVVVQKLRLTSSQW